MASAPKFAVGSVLAATYAPRVASGSTAQVRSRRRVPAIKVEDAIQPNTHGPMSICGRRWPVTLTDAVPASETLGLVETVAIVVFKEWVSGDDEERATGTG